MASVTQRVKSVKQPYGGYLPMKLFSKEVLDDGILLNDEENVHASLVGMAVDYLTRYMSGDSVDKAFHISSLGARQIGMQDKAKSLKAKISGLDDNSVIAACKLAGFDVCYRSSVNEYKSIDGISPDVQTIENIRTMVNRSLSFLKKYGPVVHSEPTFEGGYSAVVDSGDGDFVTKDTLWDFKVSKSNPTSKHSLQILMYYVMGLHSIHNYFKDITKLGFFNPRLNTVYICQISTIPKETIQEIERNVICYNTYQCPPEHNQTNFSGKVFNVSDICQITGQKKSHVYSDIRAGKLIAGKSGNKYFVFEDNFNNYINYIKTKKLVVLIATILVNVFALIIILSILFGN